MHRYGYDNASQRNKNYSVARRQSSKGLIGCRLGEPCVDPINDVLKAAAAPVFSSMEHSFRSVHGDRDVQFHSNATKRPCWRGHRMAGAVYDSQRRLDRKLVAAIKMSRGYTRC